MAEKKGRPSEESSEAPESGTVRDETSGNNPSNRGINPGQGDRSGGQNPAQPADDPSVASEEA